MSITAKGKKWEVLHSLWIGWTFTFLLRAIVFIYVGLRARQKKWILWGLVYSVPFILFLVAVAKVDPASSLATVIILAMFFAGLASILHAFKVRREYLLRLEASSRTARDTPTTSKGARWEILHSLWIGWTFTLSFFNWAAFLYIGFRSRQKKWVLWGLFYSVPLLIMIFIGPPQGLPTWLALAAAYFFIGLGLISIMEDIID